LFPRTYLRRWRRGVSPSASDLVPFQVVCPCGRPVLGRRQRQHQVLPCPSCGQPLFILPRSPWPVGKAAASVATSLAAGSRRPWWYLPVGAGVAALIVIGGVYLWLWTYLTPRNPSPSATPVSSPLAAVREHLAAGQQALAEGHFRKARRLLLRALELQGRGSPLPPAEQRLLVQLHRQADLLAALMGPSLQEVLQHGLRVRDEEEWQAQLADYRGRAVLFDDVVRHDAAGRPALAAYTVAAGGVPARVALEDVALLQRLPLDPPRRMLFGARLDRVVREEGGAWVVHFQPDSGVLLTDPGAAAACLPAPLGDDVLEVLQRQQEWLVP
jgi:hypothetical protein